MAERGEVYFTINGEPQQVSVRESWLTLADYIRDVALLKGTKITCRDGGCGACAIVVTKPTGCENKMQSFAINSCICPVFLADGWAITTVEGVGARREGYHPIQKRLADYNASQCGFCTPGMTMALYGSLVTGPVPCEVEMERTLDGQVCRCTGYRPILDAAKSFAKTSTHNEIYTMDIEDLEKTGCLRKGTGGCCRDDEKRSGPLTLKLKDGKTWYKVTSLEELLFIKKQNGPVHSVRLVQGNTSLGVFQRDVDSANVLIDISSIPEMHVVDMKDDLTVGAGLSLSTLRQMLPELAKENPQFRYLTELARIFEKIGNKSVRNMGTWAGNLMLQYHHPNFPSDISVILEAAGARLEICDGTGSRDLMSLDQLWKLDMTDRVILNMRLSPMEEDTVFRAYKIMPRSTNSYSLINGCLRMRINKDNFCVVSRPVFVFGCVGGTYVCAKKSGKYLEGKSLLDNQAIEEALDLLRSEIKPPDHVMTTSPEYRRDLAVGLFYKFILGVLGDKVPAHLRSGAGLMERPLSRGQQEYQVKDELLGKSVPKRGIIQQAAGETRYVGDIPRHEGELHAAYVLSTIARGTIDEINMTEALGFPGVVKILTAEDISVVEKDSEKVQGMKILSDGKIDYINEPVAMVLAESQLAADLAAGHVKVSYKDIETPILDIHKAIELDSRLPDLVTPVKVGDVSAAFESCENLKKGTVNLGAQNHFFMETQTSLSVPNEDTMDVWSSTQFLNEAQHHVAMATGRSMNSVHVTVPAVGGAFGGKEAMANLVAASTAVAAEVMKRPVRMVMNLKDTLQTGVKRYPMVIKYKVGFGKAGKIKAVCVDIFVDCGTGSFPSYNTAYFMKAFGSVYAIPNWLITLNVMKTNHRQRGFMRSPFHFPATCVMETLMDHVAKAVSRDPLDIRLMHLRRPGDICLFDQTDNDYCINELWREFSVTSDYEKRKQEIQEFNKNNRWRKRGMSVVPSGYYLVYLFGNFSCFLAVYEKDGSVAVSHGGTEMGQGINTKVCQAVAQTLGIPIKLVYCRPVNSLVGANCFLSGASVASEQCVKAAVEASKILQDRLKPILEKNPKASWQELVSLSHQAQIDLTVQSRCTPQWSLDKYNYATYGVCVAEAEVDILSGQYQINRVDIMMDLGESMNPMLDVGQIEGAFVMGMGYMLMEKEIMDPSTGKVLSNSTQSYKVPMAQDIPTDFRISLRKDSINKVGVTRSRAVGEPPISMAPSVVLAIKAAIEASREERGYKPEFLHIDPPLTVDLVQKLAGVRPEDLLLQ